MDVTLSGNGSKVSDGQPANVDLSTLVDNLIGVNLNRDGLTLDDFSWNTSDGSAPIEVGNYTITLNENGLKKLQINNSNYTVNVTGEFKYTIIAASQKIEYVDGNGNIIKVIDNIGTDASNYGEKVDFDVKQNVPENYKLVNSNVPTQVTIENGVTRFVIEPNIVTTTDTKTVTRTIIVETPDSSENKVVQTVTFTRPKYTDPVNGEVTYGEWDKASGSWDKYNAPEIPGYTSNEVPEEVVTPDTADKTVSVKYTKSPLIETTDTKTVTRTIIVENPDGSESKVVQTVTFTRPQYTDPVNGEVTYGDWDKSSGNWSKYTAPEIPGYTSNEVPGEVVTPDTEDQTIRIGYSKQQELETPTIPSQTADNKESGKVSAVKQQVSTIKISETKIVNTVQKKVGKQASRNRAQVNKKNDHTLPQTGAHKDMLAIISGALAVGIGLLELSLDRKKKK
ncbi:mucin-binding protein [Lactobacillus johnsonii]|nr:MBG domain-containing protein [Lactobacillus johnsonii]